VSLTGSFQPYPLHLCLAPIVGMLSQVEELFRHAENLGRSMDELHVIFPHEIFAISVLRSENDKGENIIPSGQYMVRSTFSGHPSVRRLRSDLLTSGNSVQSVPEVRMDSTVYPPFIGDHNRIIEGVCYRRINVEIVARNSRTIESTARSGASG
jgi:hypothetical protein